VLTKGRPVRGNAGQKLQALSAGYPQPKDKAGPCILKRSDGQTVKLVCLDCNRENFSSTQGFINHCRIAHKRDFKSHEEAAVQSGHPIEVGDNAGGASASSDDKPQSNNNSPCTTHVHPFARQDLSDQQAYAALRLRIAASLKLYHQGKLPGVGAIPSWTGVHAPVTKKRKAAATEFNPAIETPYLSRLMKSRNFNGNLCDLVADAKTKISVEDMTPDEESDDTGTPITAFDGPNDAVPARTPVVKRVPAQSGKAPASSTDSSSTRPASSKSRAPPMSLVSPPGSTLDVMSKRGSDAALSDEDVDMDEANLSPNTLVSNNAPSLVSDDGEYDDSDDGSSISGGSDEHDDESVSDVAEITLDDDNDSRSLRRGSNGVSGTVRLRKDDAKKQHVTFLGPVKNHTKERRSRRP
jgi:ADA HAT complex component 1